MCAFVVFGFRPMRQAQARSLFMGGCGINSKFTKAHCILKRKEIKIFRQIFINYDASEFLV